MYCGNCGRQYEGNFCPECGTPSKKIELKNENEEKRFPASESNESRPLVYKLSAGWRALNGERKLVTEFQVNGDEIIAISYRKTSKSEPFSSYTFHKRNIKSVAYDTAYYFNILNIVTLIVFGLITILGIFIPGLFIMGPLCMLIVCRYSWYDTMVVTLDNGVQVKAFYREQTETAEIYRILTGVED